MIYHLLFIIYSHRSLRQLHGEAVDASVLTDDGERIYADNLTVGEGKLNLSLCLLVFLRLVVSRINHGSVENEEVGVGGRQSVALAVLVGCQSVALVIDGIRHRKLEQAIRVSLESEKFLELLFEGMEVLILLIFRVVTTYI